MEYDIVTQRKIAASDRLLNYEANNEKLLKMHQSTAKTRLILGGKRSGKTTWGVVECSWAALGVHPYLDYPKPPLKIRVCGVSNAGIRSILLPMFYDWIPRHAIKHYWPDDARLDLANGSFIEFKSYEQDLEKYEGTERHICWMDEEPPRDRYESNFMRTISCGINGKVMITCTPLHGLNWIYDELYDNPKAIPPAVEHVHVSIYDNPHIGKDAIEAAKNDPAMQDSLDSALYGLFIPKSGLIYKSWEPDKHIIPPIDKPDKDWLLALGMDLHDRNPHGVAFMGLNKDNVWTVYDEIYEQMIISDLAAKIKSKMGSRWPPNLAIADTSLNTPQSISGVSEAQELALKYGIYITEAHKDVQSGILKVMALLNPGEGKKPSFYVTENCRNVIREFKHYTWDERVRSKDKYDLTEKPRKKDDHLLDAIRYVVMAQIVYRAPGWKYERKPPERISKTTGYY